LATAQQGSQRAVLLQDSGPQKNYEPVVDGEVILVKEPQDDMDGFVGHIAYQM
jgi:hypothetical protein